MSDETPKQKKLTAYERWELPNLDSSRSPKPSTQSVGIAVREEEAVEVTEEIDEGSLVYEPLTAQQLEEIRNAAYEEGFAQGERDGLQKGQEEGLEKGRESGFSEGYDKGLEQGTSEAKEAGAELAKTQLSEVERLLNSALQEFERPLEQSRDVVEEMLRMTAKRLVEHVLKRELSDESEQLLTSELSNALTGLSEFEGRASLVVHPSSIEAIEALTLDSRLQIKIKPDESLLPGGFMLDSQAFFVDGRLETRLQEILSFLDKP